MKVFSSELFFGNEMIFYLLSSEIPSPRDLDVKQLGNEFLQIQWKSPSDGVIQYKLSLLFVESQQVVQALYTCKLP